MSEDLDNLSLKLSCGDLIRRIFLVLDSNVVWVYIKMNSLVKIPVSDYKLEEVLSKEKLSL